MELIYEKGGKWQNKVYLVWGSRGLVKKLKTIILRTICLINFWKNAIGS